jgi:hypothetical protein
LPSLQVKAKVIDNNTGATLSDGFDIDQNKIYNDMTLKPYTTSYDYPCGDGSCTNTVNHWQLYNLKNGEVKMDTTNFPGSSVNSDTFQYSTSNFSSDGKLTVYNVSTKINSVYDIITGNHLYDINGISIPISWGQTVNTLLMTGDGMGMLTTNLNNYNTTYGIQGFKTDIRAMQAGNYSNGSIIDNTRIFYDGTLYVSAK